MTGAGPIPPVPTKGWRWLAFAWGLAEATCFFIVPDVLTSRLVLLSPRAGFLACVWGLAGALLGGGIVFLAAGGAPRADDILALYQHLPGISPRLVEESRTGFELHGMLALFIGAAIGIPYKLYAVHAAVGGFPLVVFLLASAAARLLRFCAVTALAWTINAPLVAKMPLSRRLWLHAVAWTAFYAFYFWRMSG